MSDGHLLEVGARAIAAACLFAHLGRVGCKEQHTPRRRHFRICSSSGVSICTFELVKQVNWVPFAHYAVKSGRQHTPAFASTRQHTSAYLCSGKRQPAYASLRQYPSAYVSIHQHTYAVESGRQHTPASVSIRQHTYAVESGRQHTPTYASIRQHTSAYLCSGKLPPELPAEALHSCSCVWVPDVCARTRALRRLLLEI